MTYTFTASELNHYVYKRIMQDRWEREQEAMREAPIKRASYAFLVCGGLCVLILFGLLMIPKEWL